MYLNGTVIQIKLQTTLYILLFINEPLHVTVKYNVRDEIYRVVTFTPK